MNLTEQINNDIKHAMKAKESGKLAALRDIKSKLLLEMTKEGTGEGSIEESVALSILNKLLKQRTEAAEIYKSQGREDLMEEELQQAEVIKTYLPAALSQEELEKAVKDIVTRLGASGMADMGKVMGVASKELAGRADGKAISSLVRGMLS